MVARTTALQLAGHLRCNGELAQGVSVALVAANPGIRGRGVIAGNHRRSILLNNVVIVDDGVRKPRSEATIAPWAGSD